jgi:hypothetical protein
VTDETGSPVRHTLRRWLGWLLAKSPTAAEPAAGRANATAHGAGPELARQSTIGLVDGVPVMRGLDVHADELSLAAVQSLARLGVRSVRTTLHWARVCDATGRQFDITSLDAQHAFAGVRRALSAGLRPLIVIDEEPDHVRHRTPHERIDAMAAFATSCASWFRGCAWQLWQQPDTSTYTDLFVHADGGDDDTQRAAGELYAAQLHAAYRPIMRADHTALVVSGGVQVNVAAFVAGLCSLSPDVDAIGVDAYEAPIADTALRHLADVRSAGWAGPVWLTEAGTALGDEGQAAAIRALAYATHGYGRVFVYAHRSRIEPQYALLRGDGSMRPAAGIVAASNGR